MHHKILLLLLSKCFNPVHCVRTSQFDSSFICQAEKLHTMGRNKRGSNKKKSAGSPSKSEDPGKAVQVSSKTKDDDNSPPLERSQTVATTSTSVWSDPDAPPLIKSCTESSENYPPLEKSQTVGTTYTSSWRDPDAPPLFKSRTESSARTSKHTSFEDDWKIIQQMSFSDKRALYTCKDYVTKDEISPWSDMGRMLTNVRPTSKDRDFIGQCDYQWDPVINGKIALFTGDITALEIDCIVNAANTLLLGGGGVDGAIHRGAGRSLYKQCLTLDGCNSGEAKITYGFNLPAKYVIHTVGPIDRNPNVLHSAYTKTLKLAMEEEIRSIAFPCIATGVYGYPNDKAAKMAIGIAREFLEKHPNKFDLIVFCLFMPKDIELYRKFMHIIFPVSEQH